MWASEQSECVGSGLPTKIINAGPSLLAARRSGHLWGNIAEDWVPSTLIPPNPCQSETY